MQSDQRTHQAASTADWDRTLIDALASANIPTLLLVLVHLTGDKRWLSEQFQCGRAQGLEELDSGGLDDQTRAEVSAAAGDAIKAWKQGRPPALPSPDVGLLTEMMRVSTGE